jgi:hypothetical protein
MTTQRSGARMIGRALGGAAALALAGAGHAMTLADYRAYRTAAAAAPAATAVARYIDGIGTGLVWADAYLAARNQPKMFCAPATLPAEGGFAPLLDAQIASHRGLTTPYPDDTNLALILLNALMLTYPCP